MPFALWLQDIINALSLHAPPGSVFYYSTNISSLLGVVVVSLICGAVGSLVVGNRMAFFSDALAHSAFAGIAIGLATGIFLHAPKNGPFITLGVPLIMVVFGVFVGLGIAFVREKTTLASDTVIGVFFAGAIGIGAVLLDSMSRINYFKPENFLFGSPMNVDEGDLLLLLALTLIEAVILAVLYNQLVFTSFNVVLARSRNIPVRLCNYVFIVLLALIVNLSVKAVGALLINAMLIVPAASAANFCRNMRQLFWTTILISLAVSLAGWWLSIQIEIPVAISREPLTFGPSGLIVVLTVVIFFLSVFAGPRLRNRLLKAAPVTGKE